MFLLFCLFARVIKYIHLTGHVFNLKTLTKYLPTPHGPWPESYSCTANILSGSRSPSDLRFSCRLPHTLLIKKINWRLWTLLFNTIPQTSHSELSKASWVISGPLDTPHPWMWMNWTAWRATKLARAGPVPSDICRFAADYKFNRIYRSQCWRICSKENLKSPCCCLC